MSWTVGTGTIHNVARQADETFPSLVSDAGEKLVYVGPSGAAHSEIFNYQDSLVDFSFHATRNTEFRGPLLASDGHSLGDAWTINFREFMITPKAGVALSREILLRIQSNIEGALLSRPLWPSSYGRPDLPAKSVTFISAN